MHELWICRNILEIVKEHASIKPITRIKTITLEVGQLSQLNKEALLFSFDVVTKGTIAENATLKFIDIAGQAYCDCCQKTIAIHQYDQTCHHCGSFVNNIKSGEELRVKSMEAE